ncbi:MAG: hypothetical protein LBE22_12360 [Azoarcus sp.]|jgi:hypothetical protein|nr:hypothetical protein [Azoarcus sp.]
MKAVNLSIPVRVSDCGKYCDDHCKELREGNPFYCVIFTEKRSFFPQILKAKIAGKNVLVYRCKQCLDAEIVAGNRINKPISCAAVNKIVETIPVDAEIKE